MGLEMTPNTQKQSGGFEGVTEIKVEFTTLRNIRYLNAVCGIQSLR